MNFVAMNAADVEAVAALEARLQVFPWTAGNFRDALDAGYEAWLVREGKQLRGFAVLMHAVDEAHLLTIGVVPEYQRRGFGRALLDFVMARARAADRQRLLLEVRPSNTHAREFYRRTGFAEIGRRRGYYPAATGREDAIVMARNL